jgi:hypothetical protein
VVGAHLGCTTKAVKVVATDEFVDFNLVQYLLQTYFQ